MRIMDYGVYRAAEDRYSTMQYNRCGKSGVLMPAISLGLWQNFGFVNNYDNCEKILKAAFDKGITCFDLANNYGPPYGSAERNFGRIFDRNFKPYRDEMLITSKAGYDMWPGPYGNWGSKKYLVASCDQSLKRMGLDYLDIFYSHRYDPETPLEETMGALDYIVRSGRALYAGLSNYPADKFVEAVAILRRLGTPCLIHQIKYSMLVREIGESLFGAHEREGIGCTTFSPLAQGQLTDRYLNGIPQDSRAAREGFLKSAMVEENLPKVRALNEVAKRRGQTLAQMAISWQLGSGNVSSVLIGVSSTEQLDSNLAALDNTVFSAEEMAEINKILEA